VTHLPACDQKKMARYYHDYEKFLSEKRYGFKSHYIAFCVDPWNEAYHWYV
jgi:hypothetical protein